MVWPLTLVGVMLGAFIGGVPSAILGGVLGHALDRYWHLYRWSDLGRELARRLGFKPSFEQVLFQALGRIAKSQGRVTVDHVQLGRELMAQYRLDESQKPRAIASFNRGKQPSARIDRSLRRLFRQQPGRAAELLDCCWRMALVNPPPSETSRLLLNQWSIMAGLSQAEQQRLRQRHQRQERRRTSGSTPAPTGGSLQQAALLLGVELDAEPAHIKRAYRRLLSRHHPDKLVSTGASAAELTAAGEQVHKIQQAYEIIRRYRGFR